MGIGPNAAVSVAKAPGDGITGAGPAIITTGSGVGDRLTAEKAAPNQAAFLYSCAGADQIRTRDQSSVKNSYVFDWTHQLNQNTQLKLQVFKDRIAISCKLVFHAKPSKRFAAGVYG